MDLLFQEMMLYRCCKEYHPGHAIISAACALEALKLFSGCSRSVSNYLTGDASIFIYRLLFLFREPHTVGSDVFTCSMYGSCSSLPISTHQSFGGSSSPSKA
ncbi:uncharacterized protein [Lolium perenne]|uniref:uncharacterized protein n=1 Tax=Lolium perenne TaxID=4522 RepID=UPI003A9A269B